MRLTIYDVQRIDYGMYKCVAKNPRGETDGSIRLYCEYATGFLRAKQCESFENIHFEIKNAKKEKEGEKQRERKREKINNNET